MKYLIILTCILFTLAGCSNTNSDLKIVADFSSLNGKNFVMEVNKVAESLDVQFPGDELEETDYIDYYGDKNYSISFSENGQIVTIEPGSISGNKINTEAKSVSYELTDGLFAGGRFIVRIDEDKFDAELTIYGSGIPIVSSERGSLLAE